MRAIEMMPRLNQVVEIHRRYDLVWKRQWHSLQIGDAEARRDQQDRDGR
jgi:hypothetical protein